MIGGNFSGQFSVPEDPAIGGVEVYNNSFFVIGVSSCYEGSKKTEK